MIVTPLWEEDLCARIAELRPDDFTVTGDEPNIHPHVEGEINDTRHDGSIAGREHTAVRLVTQREDLHNDGQEGYGDLQVLHRYDPGASITARRDALAKMRAVHDRLHAQGAWTGASGQLYTCARSTSPPVILQRGYIVFTITVWAEQPDVDP